MQKKMNAKELRLFKAKKKDLQNLSKQEIYILLDNVLDTYNIGSVFRLAEAIGAKKVFLTAGSETPPNHRIKKASINTTELVDWAYFEKPEDAVLNLKQTVPGIKIISVEQTSDSKLYTDFEFSLPVCLIVGNETTGVSDQVLALSDAIVELPMFGINISLNVMVSLGIVLYEVIRQTQKN